LAGAIRLRREAVTIFAIGPAGTCPQQNSQITKYHWGESPQSRISDDTSPDASRKHWEESALAGFQLTLQIWQTRRDIHRAGVFRIRVPCAVKAYVGGLEDPTAPAKAQNR
tara:strand:+ start:182 stop:514 length:333 start_codon:yes stop_codon:yes gene_type:complete